jgi:hypothetical protein
LEIVRFGKRQVKLTHGRDLPLFNFLIGLLINHFVFTDFFQIAIRGIAMTRIASNDCSFLRR